MNPILKNVLAVVAGVILGSAANFGLILLGHAVVPLPEGVDVMSPEGLKAAMSVFEAKHFIFPLLAHAVGTLVGAFVAAKIAANNKMNFAYGIGAFFLLGGIYNMINLPAPMWVEIIDIALAYIPMAWLGGKWATRAQA